MFNSKGVWENQKVYLGKTQTGIYGYFTSGLLVRRLSETDFAKSTQWHIDNCKQFELDFLSINY